VGTGERTGTQGCQVTEALRYWEDHSIQTVSELLDLSPGVVKVQSMRALARLRALLGEDEASPPLPPEPGVRDAIPRPPVARSRP
jgi:hypothetical protein